VVATDLQHRLAGAVDKTTGILAVEESCTGVLQGMPLTVAQLRDALKNLPDDLEVTFLQSRNHRLVCDTAFSAEVVERDTNSHAPKTGRRIETSTDILKGGNEKVLALSDR